MTFRPPKGICKEVFVAQYVNTRMYSSITIHKQVKLMSNKRITLSVDAEIYEDFKEYCDKEGLIISKQIENYMRAKLDSNKIKV